MVWRRKRAAPDITEGAAAKQAESSVANSDAHTVSNRGAPRTETPVNSDKVLKTDGRLELGFEPLPAGYTMQRRYTVPRSYRISGSIVSGRPVSVSGEIVEGQLSAQVVTVMPGGRVGSQIRAGTVQVAGAVSGDIRAKGLVDVSSMGEITGLIETPQLRAVPGAKLSGASLKVG
jgi:hypothetical protein